MSFYICNIIYIYSYFLIYNVPSDTYIDIYQLVLKCRRAYIWMRKNSQQSTFKRRYTDKLIIYNIINKLKLPFTIIKGETFRRRSTTDDGDSRKAGERDSAKGTPSTTARGSKQQVTGKNFDNNRSCSVDNIRIRWLAGKRRKESGESSTRVLKEE